MPHQTPSVPSYRQKKNNGKPTGLAVVTLSDSVTKRRRDVYLGAFGSPEAGDLYKRIIRKRKRAGWCLGTVVFAPAQEDTPYADGMVVEAKRASTGSETKLEDDEELIYLGIRLPYGNEALHEEAKNRNHELVAGKDLQLRFAGEPRDRKNRLRAYVCLEDKRCVNEILVREGRAFVRLRDDVNLLTPVLLKALDEAREAQRWIWKHVKPGTADEYYADHKYAELHLPSCEVATKIKPERRLKLPSKLACFKRGHSPCNKCNP